MEDWIIIDKIDIKDITSFVKKHIKKENKLSLEYKSTVENPHPLFVNFIKAAEKWKIEATSTAQEA